MVWDRLPLYAFLKRHTRFRHLVIKWTDRFARMGGPRSGEKALSQISLGAAGLTTSVGADPEGSLMTPPGSLPQEFLMFRAVPANPITVTSIPQGKALGIHGAPATADGGVIVDLAWGPHQLLALTADEFVAAAADGKRMRPHRLSGRAGLLTTNFGRGYFHWLVDVLPRAEALRRGGVDPRALDHVIVPSLIAPFQIETLHAIGLQRRQLVSSLRHRHVVADDLLVPSLVRPTGPIPRWACEFLRSSIAPATPREQGLPDRLLITRKATDHGFSGLHEVLHKWGRRHGFAPIALEDFSMAEKAWIMARTRVLVGESGAGLTNIVFSSPGASLIEITNLTVPDPVFWDLATQCGHHYRSVPTGGGAESVESALDGALAEIAAL